MKWMKKLRRAHAVQLVRVGFPGRLGAHGGARVAFVANTRTTSTADRRITSTGDVRVTNEVA